MDRASAALEQELGRAPAAPEALELRVLEGPQRGARNALVPGRACVIAAGLAAGADIVLQDERAASVRVTVDTAQSLVEVMHGEVTIGEQALSAGGHAVWPRHAPMRIGSSVVAFGLAGQAQWTADETAPAAAEEAPAPPPLRRRAEVWLGATGAAILLTCAGTLWLAHVAAGPRAPALAAPVRPVAAARNDEALEREVAEVFRVNGVTVRAHSSGAGQIVVDATERDADKLARAEEAVRRDVHGFESLAVHNRPEPLPPPPRPVVEDPGKRIASLVPGDPGYVVTADGARYFVGALLPTGDRLVQVAPGVVTLERDGRNLNLNF